MIHIQTISKKSAQGGYRLPSSKFYMYSVHEEYLSGNSFAIVLLLLMRLGNE